MFGRPQTASVASEAENYLSIGLSWTILTTLYFIAEAVGAAVAELVFRPASTASAASEAEADSVFGLYWTILTTLYFIAEVVGAAVAEIAYWRPRGQPLGL